MRLTKSPFRSTLAVTVAAALGAVMMVPAASSAAPATITADQASSLAAELDSAGAYLDQATGRIVIPVTTESAAERARAAGADARLVERGAAELQSIVDVLDRTARIPGTAWAVDPIGNQVIVSVDSTLSPASLARIEGIADRFGDAIRIERTGGILSTTINGGQAIYGGGSRCSLGFNVRSGTTYYFLTAGHCTNISASWYANSSQTTYIGPRVGTSFPGNDYGIVRYDSSLAHPGTVYLWNGTSRDITGAGTPTVGQTVYRSGSTTGLHSGTVQALNATVTYPQGTVYGLIRTSVCAEPGDSGGSLFAGNTAYGLTSGGSGNCTFGGTTYFQPVTEPLSVYGVSVY